MQYNHYDVEDYNYVGRLISAAVKNTIAAVSLEFDSLTGLETVHYHPQENFRVLYRL